MEKFDVIILCGGVGERIKNINKDIPKILIDVAGETILEKQLHMISVLPVSRIFLATHYYSEKIEKYCKVKNINKVIIVKNDKELGTAGALLDVIKKYRTFTKKILVINGDILTDINLFNFVKFFNEYMDCLMVTTVSDDASDFGSVTTVDSNKITSFTEKKADISRGKINAGIYIFSNKFFLEMLSEPLSSLENEVFPKMTSLFSYEHEGSWFDIGTQKRYLQAMEFFSDKLNYKNS